MLFNLAGKMVAIFHHCTKLGRYIRYFKIIHSKSPTKQKKPFKTERKTKKATEKFKLHFTGKQLMS